MLDQLRAQRGSSRMVRRWLGGAEAVEDVSTAPDAEQPVGAVAGQELVPELFLQRQIAREQVRRQQPLEEVVVPAVPVTPSEAEHARDGVCLEHGAHCVRRYPEPVGLRPTLALEIERRQRSLRADLLEHPLGHLGVLGECPRRLLVDGRAEPGELARRDEGEPLVVRLEDLASVVQQLAPGGFVLGDPRVQHEVVCAAGNRDGVELDRAEPAEDLEHRIGASLERSRRCEEAPGNEKAARGLSGDFHGREPIRERRDSNPRPSNCAFWRIMRRQRAARRPPVGTDR